MVYPKYVLVLYNLHIIKRLLLYNIVVFNNWKSSYAHTYVSINDSK